MQPTAPSSDTPLSKSLRTVVGALLAISLMCNVAMLIVPFMDLRIGLRSDPYRLTDSIAMMWDQGLYMLTILVVGFSVIFPFAKLSALAWICSRPVLTPAGRRWLHRLELLGKWSMLDVFLVCIILTLTTNQIFVGAEPLIGIPIFTVAIMLSMISGELLSRAAIHANEKTPAPAVLKPNSKRDGLWLALSGLALLGALAFPFLQISDWKLANHHYSIFTLGLNLFHQGSVFTALIITVFLVVTPLAAWLQTWFWLRKVRRGQPAEKSARSLQILNRWSMLDVFGLALIIFLIEGEYLMKTEIRWGSVFLGALLVLQKAGSASLTRKI